MAMNNAMQKRRTANEFSEIWDSKPSELDAPGFARNKVFAGSVALLLILFLLSLVIPIGTAVLGSGEVVADGQNKRVAHPNGGVIAELLVENGDVVEEGDLLIKLEDTVSGATATFSTMTVEQLLAQRARLEAERIGASRVRFPAELQGNQSPTAIEAMADEQRLFEIRNVEQRQLRAQLNARVEQLRQQIAGYEQQIAAYQQQLALIGPELEGLRDLWEQELVTINRLNQLERTQVGLNGSIASMRTDVARTNAAIAEMTEALIQLDQSRRADAAAELTRLNTVLNEQRSRNALASNQQFYTEIRAPYSGTIEKLAFASTGDVITPAQTILELVPNDEPLVVEAAISPSDIDRVVSGQNAQLRFASFNLSSTPTFSGEVTYVASDRVQDEATGIPFYLVRIEFEETELVDEGIELRSGMPAEVVIETGSRSLISFLVKPLADQFNRAFRYD